MMASSCGVSVGCGFRMGFRTPGSVYVSVNCMVTVMMTGYRDAIHLGRRELPLAYGVQRRLSPAAESTAGRARLPRSPVHRSRPP
jgi:hypothetical protein